MTKKQIAEQERTLAIARLRKCCPPGTTIHVSLVSVSRSGMYRRLKLYIDQCESITADVATVLGLRFVSDGSLGIYGCGMDMGFSVVYSLSSVLWRDNFRCLGKDARCPSNDHSNGDRNYARTHKHSDGGYALRHRWM